METTIFKFARERNLICGICDTEPMTALEPILAEVRTPFVTEDIGLRLEPRRTMANAESVIVLGMGYNKKFSFETDDLPRGEISMGAVGTDYHVVLKKILYELVCELQIKTGPFDYRIFVDNGPLLERELAKKAGLGFSGKNCCLISPVLGSFFYIGYILTELSLGFTVGEDYEAMGNRCGECRRCIEACPGGALSDFKCSYEKCVSYLTQFKGELTEGEKKSMGLRVYGCDVCQNVCPFNQGKFVGEILDIEQVRPELEKIIGMDKKYFQENFKHRACGWRGRNVLRRNGGIALENYERFYMGESIEK